MSNKTNSLLESSNNWRAQTRPHSCLWIVSQFDVRRPCLANNGKSCQHDQLLASYRPDYDIALDTAHLMRARVVEFIDAQSVCLMRVG